MKFIVIVLTLLLAANLSEAKTSVKASLDQLQTNKENSAKNLKQYEDNLEIVNHNVTEAQKAIKSLHQQKKSLSVNVNNVEKNKKAIEAMRKKVLEHKMTEVQKLEEDIKDIKRLEDLLAKLNTNKEKREENLKAYNIKLDEIVKEKEAWDNQKASMNDLNKTIDSKLVKAQSELKKWQGKQKSYQQQVKKWEAETTAAAKIHKKFEDLQ